MAWIETVSEEEAQPPLSDCYEIILKGSEVVPNIYKIQSLAPKALDLHRLFYKELVFGKSPLKRYQREMIATHVSNVNACHY